MSNIELDIVTRGSVSGGVKGEIVNTLKDCFRQFGPRVPYKVEILITDTEAILRDYLRQEKFKMGVLDDSLEDTICLYDILKGYPRINISSEKLKGYSKLARLGLIRHQVAHSILHGSMEYRIFKIPEDCRQIAMVKGIELNILDLAMHKLALAIKDGEASKLLVEHNFVNCQLSFALEWIQPQLEARFAPKPIKIDRQQKFISQILLLKPMLFSLPLMTDQHSKKIAIEKQVLLGRRIEQLLQGLVVNEQNKLLQVASLITDALTEDTHYNMDSALHQALSIA